MTYLTPLGPDASPSKEPKRAVPLRLATFHPSTTYQLYLLDLSPTMPGKNNVLILLFRKCVLLPTARGLPRSPSFLVVLPPIATG